MKKLLCTALLGAVFTASAQTSTNIAYLRTLVDGVNYLPTDTNTVYVAEGVVTTHNNLTGPANSLFYFQDATAGIAVFASGLTATPPAGASVTVTGRLDHFNGLLEYRFDVSVGTNSLGNPLPTAQLLDFNLTAAQYEALEGSYVVATNVRVDQSSTSFAGGNSTVIITNESNQTFAMFVNANTDIPNKPRPSGVVTIYGVLGQFDTTDPRTEGYQLIPSRFVDIVDPNPPPIVAFTNVLSNLVRPGDAPVSTSFTEYALRTGETLTINALAYDNAGSNVTIYPSTTAPGGNWSFSGTNGTAVPATFTYTAQAGHAGSSNRVVLEARTSIGVNVTTWTIFVPTAEEQNVVISEFLASPTTDTNSPNWNPLNRLAPGSTNAFADDEFVELVNLNNASIELIGWTMRDAVSLRHEFGDFFSVGSSNTAVLYGGRKNLDPAPVSIPGASIAFSEGVVGVSVLNNGGDTISLYNALGRLVARVVYTSDSSAGGVSFTRFPTLNSDFVDHKSVVITNASPGLQPDQRGYDLPVIFADPPTITGIADQVIDVDTSTGPLAFTIGDPVTPVGDLTLFGESSNPSLVPNANIVFGGSGADRTVTVTPATGEVGLVEITITVGNDALRAASTNFQLQIQSIVPPIALFCDDFAYADGSLITNSSFLWTNHSGTIGQMQVSGGKVQVTPSSEDANRTIPGGPYLVNSGVTLYYSFTVDMTGLPSGAGSYFAHLMETSTIFRARVWAQTNTAGADKYRLGVVNGNGSGGTQGTITLFPQDLDLNATYRVVVKHSLDTGVSTLWIDPVSEASANVFTPDGPAATTIVAFALRQATGVGTMIVDDLCVGTSFDSVVPAPPVSLLISRSGSNVVLSWDDPTFNLQAAPAVTGTFTNVPGASSPHTNSASGPASYFRLIK